MKQKMLVIGIVWIAVAAALLIAHSTSWAMEKGQIRPATPHQFRDRLLPSERVIDSNPAAFGKKGNSVPDIQRLNGLYFRESVGELRHQGPGKSATGKIVDRASQDVWTG